MPSQSDNKCLSVRLEPELRAKVMQRGGARFVREAVEEALARAEECDANNAFYAEQRRLRALEEAERALWVPL